MHFQLRIVDVNGHPAAALQHFRIVRWCLLNAIKTVSLMDLAEDSNFKVLSSSPRKGRQVGESLDSQASMLNIFADFLEKINGKGAFCPLSPICILQEVNYDR